MGTEDSNSKDFESSKPEKVERRILLPVVLLTEVWSILSLEQKKSVKEACKRFGVEIDQIVDGSRPQPQNEGPCGLLSFPLEVRSEIWDFLSWDDRKSLKKVCTLFRMDINHISGVEVALSGDECIVERESGSIAKGDAVEGIVPVPNLKLGHSEQGQNPNRELSRWQQKSDWIQSVLPRSLTLRRFSKFAFDPSELLSKPLTLRRLRIEMDHSYLTSSAERLQNLYQLCNGLKQLSFTSHAVELPEEQRDAFQEFRVSVAEDLLNSLAFKLNLTELFVSIKDNIDITKYNVKNYEGTKAVGRIPEDVPNIEDKWLQRPIRLRKLSVNIVGLPVQQLGQWQKFLDVQHRLTHLTLDFGLVPWDFFTTVLQKNVRTLESLDLVLTNWFEGPVQLKRLRFKTIPDNERFSWHLIAPLAKKLKSLRISTTSSDIRDFCMYVTFSPPATSTWPHDTMNFRLMTGLTSLETLALAGIHLNRDQLLTIFTELESLRHVDLESWTLMKETNPNPEGFGDDLLSIDLTMEFVVKLQYFLFLLNSVISADKFDRIKLVDFSLMFYSEEARQVILGRSADSDYSIVWPELNLSQPNYDDYFKYPLTIQRK